MSYTCRILLVLAGACASTVLASAQAASLPTEAIAPATAAPVSYIYVTSQGANNQIVIDAYAAASNGFHFNGASPATPYTGLLTSSEVDQVSWDNANHLYAIGEKAGLHGDSDQRQSGTGIPAHDCHPTQPHRAA